MAKRTKSPISVMHCGECNHILKVYKVHQDVCSCANQHCPQYTALWPFPPQHWPKAA